VNKVKFRKYWDAELRASVYLNEFLTQNVKWMDTLTSALAPKYAELQKNKGLQLRGVIEVADEREERFLEIIDQDGDGVIKYWLAMLMIDAASAPATYQLIRVARRVGEVVVMCLKNHYQEARPSQVCPAIMPLLGPPVHPSFPAGHAIQSHLISTCLYEAGRARNQREMLFDLSRRISKNRVIAGVHYEADIDAGVIAADECFKLLREGELFTELLSDAQKEAESESGV
jgi:acid phosphatase (class A)